MSFSRLNSILYGSGGILRGWELLFNYKSFSASPRATPKLKKIHAIKRQKYIYIDNALLLVFRSISLAPSLHNLFVVFV